MHTNKLADDTKSIPPSSGPVTYRQFAALANRRGWTSASLAERFRGKIENSSEFFHRVMGGKHPDVAIPFRSVISFYNEHAQSAPQTGNGSRLCACGCQEPVFGKKKWATPGCKKRIARQSAANKQNRVSEVAEFVERSKTRNGDKALHPLTRSRTGTNRI